MNHWHKFAHVRGILAILVAILSFSTAWAEDSYPEYITELKVVGGSSSDVDSETATLKNQGWTRIDQDLNEGAGGDYVYLFYKKSSRENPNGGYITDIIIRTSNEDSYTTNGRTYYRIGCDGNAHFRTYKGNLNSGTKQSSTNMWIYATTSNFSDKRAVDDIWFNNGKNGAVSGIDLNEGAGGDYIYMHFSTATKQNRPSSDPELLSYVYNGNNRNLVSSNGTLWDGTMYYRLSPKGPNLSKNDVTARDAGTYTVYYFAGPTDYASSSTLHSQEVTIYKSPNRGVSVDIGASYPEGTSFDPTITGTNLSTGSITYQYATSQDGKYYSKKPKSAGTYWVHAVIAGDDNCEEYTTWSKSFKILPLIQGENFLISAIPAQTYTGSAICPTISIMEYIPAEGMKTLRNGSDYTVSCYNNVSANSNAYAYISGKGNYAGSLNKYFEISPKSVQNLELVYDEHPIYTGSAICPDVVVKDGEKTLVQGTDYTVECENNVNVGDKATIGVFGIGNYTGSSYGSFIVALKSIASQDVEVATTWEKAGSEYIPIVVVKDGEQTLQENVDYTVDVSAVDGNVNAVVNGLGIYIGTVQKNISEVHTVSVPEGFTISDAYTTINTVKYYKSDESYTLMLSTTKVNEVIDRIIGVTGSNTWVSVSVAADKRRASFKMPNEKVSISATTTEVYTVTVPEGFTISDAYTTIGTKKYYMIGEAYTLTVPKVNYVIDEITGVEADIASNRMSATFTMPAKDVEIFATISKKWGEDGGRDGSKEHPYTIASAFELDILAFAVNSGNDFTNTYFEVTENIVYDVTKTDNENNYTAIGDESHPFNGKFNGNGKTISGIRIYDLEGEYQGLFGHLGEGAEVENVKLADVEITARNDVGGVAGQNHGVIRNCTVEKTVKIKGDYNNNSSNYKSSFGGIVGLNRGTVLGCTSSASLTSSHNYHSQKFGGIAGFNRGTVSGCTSFATLTSLDKINYGYGGIVGENDYGTVSGCTSSATLIASGTGSEYYGGIVGEDGHGTISSNFAKNVTVSGAISQGSLVGKAYYTKLSNNFYTACTIAGEENASKVGVSEVFKTYYYVKLYGDVTEDNGAVAVSFTAPVAAENLVYNKSSRNLVTAGKTNFGTLLYSLDGENYDTEIPTAVEAQSYTVYYKVDSDNGSVVDPQTIEVSIAPKKSVSNIELVYDERPVYTGSAICPDVIVKDGEKTLVQGTDYTVVCESATNVGEKGAIGIVGIGNYTDSQYGPVMIAPKSVQNFELVYDERPVYTGSAICPEVVVKDGEKTLVQGTDYTVVCERATDVGEKGAIGIVGMGNYTDSQYGPVMIVPAEVLVSDAVRILEDQNGKHVEIDAEYSGKEPVSVPDAVAVDFVEVKRNLVPLTPATIVLPVQLPEGTTLNARFYYLKEVKQVGCSWNAVMKYIGSNNLPEPNTPYAVILNDGEDKLEFDLHGEQATVRTAEIADNWDISDKWQFVGTYSYKVWEEGNDEIGLVYGFAGSNEEGIARGEFGRVKAGAYAVPMRSYLKKRDKDVRVTGCAQGIRANGAAYSASFSNTDIIGVEFIDEEEQTTAIGRMNTRTGEFKIDRWYDLKGRKVDNVNRAAKGAYYGKKVFKK